MTWLSLMPKGRGSNKARSKFQKDKEESTGKGFLKLVQLYERALKVQKARQKDARKTTKTNKT